MSAVLEQDLKLMLTNVLQKSWENVTVNLSEWQKAQLNQLDSEHGISCLLKMWLTVQAKLIQGTYCNATWDNHYCWPPTPSNTTVTRQCSDAFRETQPKYADHLQGKAYRICQANGTWLRGNWTNYSECADSYEEYVDRTEEERKLVTQVQYILFIGSILSLVSLLTAISIFCCFRSIWCDRVTIHMHLMAALTIRYVLLYIITEAFIFNREINYRSVDWVCKVVLIVYLYATLTSVNWMFIQGVYLNGKLTTNVFDKAAPFKLYFMFGWLTPLPLLAGYAFVMETQHPQKCWKGYSEMNEIWIILGPIIIALVVNLLLLFNILRILLTKVHGSSSDAKQFQRAAKATLILSPILGVNNLLFIYNPGGAYHKFYVLLNSLFGSTQGIFVALVYCYLSADVCSAIRRCYRRFLARRNAVRTMQQRQRNSCSTSSGLIVEHPVKFLRSNRAYSTSNPTLSSLQLSPVVSLQNGFIRNGRENGNGHHHARRICPVSPFSSTPRSTTTRNGCVVTCNYSSPPQSSTNNPFLSRCSYSAASGAGSTRGSGSTEELDSYNDVIIPLSELV